MIDKTITLLLALQLRYSITTDVSEYVFAAEWSVSFCRYNKGCFQDHVRPKMWTIHGLWPQSSSPLPPIGFNVSALGNQLRKKLDNAWPNVSGQSNEAFWKYEWGKHGSIAIQDNTSRIQDEKQYFSLAVTILDELQLYSTFEKCKIEPREYPYPALAFQTCLQNVSGILPTQLFFSTHRVQGENLLLEIRVCFYGENIAKQRRLKNCEKIPPVKGTKFLYPSSTHAVFKLNEANVWKQRNNTTRTTQRQKKNN